MKFALLCKRRYTNRDLLHDRFGRLFHLPFQLGALGHEGLVLAADYHGRQPDDLSQPRLSLVSIPASPPEFPAFLYTCWQQLRRFAPDCLLASADTPLGLIGLFYAKVLRIPFVFDVYDDYRVFASGRIPGMASLFNLIARRAALVVTASEPLKGIIAPMNSRVITIENGVDTALFRPISQAVARERLGLPPAEKIIGFFGSIDPERGVEILIAAAQLLRQRGIAQRLLLAGHNGLGLNLGGPGIDYRGLLPQAALPDFICACDVAVIPYLPDPQVDVSNACKIAEYLACAVPVVATRVSNHAAIFAGAAQGLCPPGSPEDMARAITAQLTKPVRVPLPREWTWENLGQRLAIALTQLDEKIGKVV